MPDREAGAVVDMRPRGRSQGRGPGALLARGLAHVVAFVVGDVLRVRRAHVEASMARAGIDAPSVRARGMFGRLARHLVAVLGLAISRRALARVSLPAVAALDGPGGAVVATAHTGNWDLTACAVAQKRPLTVVTKRLGVGALDRLWHWLRRRRGVSLVMEGDVIGAARRSLGRGEVVAMMIDQVPMRSRGVAWAPFLGALAPVDLAPALVAARAQVPLVVAFDFERDDGTHAVRVCGTFEPPPRAGRDWAAGVMTTATRLLEAFVLEHPEQWLWMHRRWLSFEERRVRRAETGCRRPTQGLSGRP